MTRNNKKFSANLFEMLISWQVITVILLIIIGGVVYFNLGDGTDNSIATANSTGAANPTYDKEIAPIMQNKCAGCHNPGGMRSNSPLDSYKGVMDYIVPGKPADSVLIQKVDGGSMGGFFSPDELDLIKKWVEQGAKEK
ncbi:MAG: hypothetical protein M0Z31_11510 [Clostridia bacterium]|nr:hypothetical protein [Clostridia bacterium]